MDLRKDGDIPWTQLKVAIIRFGESKLREGSEFRDGHRSSKWVYFNIFQGKRPEFAKELARKVSLHRGVRSLHELRLGVYCLGSNRVRVPRAFLVDEVCVFCGSREREDEAHFLLECGAWAREREDWLSGVVADLEAEVAVSLLLGGEMPSGVVRRLGGERRVLKAICSFLGAVDARREEVWRDREEVRGGRAVDEGKHEE